eukprot:SAG31_NODE_4534_length_3158_cov_2.074534_1_plen_637_part_00
MGMPDRARRGALIKRCSVRVVCWIRPDGGLPPPEAARACGRGGGWWTAKQFATFGASTRCSLALRKPQRKLEMLGSGRRLRALALAALVVIGGASAQPQSPVDSRRAGAEAVGKRECASRAAQAARVPAEVCGAVSVEEALHAVMMPEAASHRAAEVLGGLGFGTALDLELLGGGEAAAEVLTELKVRGLSPADRAKVRLLVGDREHLRRLISSPWSVPAAVVDGPKQSGAPSNCDEQVEEASRLEREWTVQGRQLQGADSSSSGGGGGGISADTIAIVLSVLVGAAGYVVQVRSRTIILFSCVQRWTQESNIIRQPRSRLRSAPNTHRMRVAIGAQAHTAKRAERAQQQHARELHVGEQARQREHQMMTAQIERTHRGLDQCCRPVLNDLYAVTYARVPMVEKLVDTLELSHPNAVAEMLSFATVVKVQPDGTATSPSTGKLYWTPNRPAELTRAMGSVSFEAPTGAAMVIAVQDFFTAFSQPFCCEMPTAILEIIGAEPAAEIPGTYRSYVRHTVMPLLQRVVDTLRNHAAHVELPPKEWLEETFPEISWRSYTNAYFVDQWYAYTLSFKRVLSQWSEGNFSSIRPPQPQPIGGMLRLLNRSQERAEARQAELIGMTSVIEIDYGSVYARLTSD